MSYSVETFIDKMHVFKWCSFGPYFRQYAIVILVNLSILGSGLGIAWSSPVLVKLSKQNSTVLGRPITAEEGSWIVSVVFLSGFLTNFLAAYLVGTIGRKHCIILSAVPRVASYLLLTFASELWMIILARAIIGMCDGFGFIIIPMYASEIASNDVRGGLGTMLQIFSSLGIVTMLCMGPFLDYVVLNEVVLCIVVVTAIPLFFLPDSPYFLYSKGRIDEATKVLTFLRGSSILASDELKEYKSNERADKITFSEVIQSKTILKALGIVIVLSIGTQLTGFNAVSFYLQPILESTHSSVSSETASVVIGVIQMVAAVCATLVVDKFGRKPILSVTLVGIILGMMGLGTFFYMSKGGSNVTGFLNYLPLISLVVVVYCFSAGLGSLNWPLMAELFTGRARAIGTTASAISSIPFIFLTTKFFAPITEVVGPAAIYWAFSVNSLILCLFILFCVPETKGKSIAEIQEALGGKRDIKEGGGRNGEKC